MEILMYGWEYPPHISGGLGVACYGIVNGLAAKGVKITFVLPQTEQDIHSSNNISIVGCNSAVSKLYSSSYHSLINTQKIDALLHPYLTAESYDNLLQQVHKKYKIETLGLNHTNVTGKYGSHLINEVIRYSILAGSLAETTPHDIIHAHDWLTILAGIYAKHISHKPLVFHVHALEFDRCGENVNRDIFAIEKYGLEQADQIVTVSHYTKNVIIQRYGIAKEKIEVVHNGIDSKSYLAAYVKKPSHKMVLFVGRITFQKGPDYFLKIAQKILTRRNDVHFVIAGVGDMMKRMIEQSAEMHISTNVHFVGFLNSEMLKRLYRMADVYVMPSVSEPFGLTCLEALSGHVPIVISKQSGVKEVLNQHVLTADFWDINDIAAKVLALLDYPALGKEIVSNANQQLKSVTWENTADKLIAIYNHLLEKRG